MTMEPRVVKLEGKYGYQRLLGGPPDTFGMKSGCLILRPGESVGEHSTGSREEAVVILRGSAEVFSGGKALETVEAPALIYFPPETAHDIKNADDTDLQYVYVVSPKK